jgi:hypothetical protein
LLENSLVVPYPAVADVAVVLLAPAWAGNASQPRGAFVKA